MSPDECETQFIRLMAKLILRKWREKQEKLAAEAAAKEAAG